jgi:hypothetical protein
MRLEARLDRLGPAFSAGAMAPEALVFAAHGNRNATATHSRKKKARGYGLKMVAGPGFEIEDDRTGE